MKIEMHLHTKSGSPCGETPEELVPSLCRQAGYGAVAVTNHYNKWIAEDFYAGLYGKKVDPVECFLHGYRAVKRAAEDTGLTVLLGMEIACRAAGYQEFMLFGFDETFLRAYPRLYELDQRELFSLCNEKGLFMYQTHPFRDGIVTGDGRFMHGVEVYNGHKGHQNHNESALCMADEYGLRQLSGSDCHTPGSAGTGGIVAENVYTEQDLVRCLQTAQPALIKN